jgi:hypothetical protein
MQVLEAFDRIQLDVIKSEFLYLLDGKPGFTSADG